jgi:replication factor C subunit 1
MDIRNFFTTKNPTNKKKVAAEEAPGGNDKKEDKKKSSSSSKNAATSKSTNQAWVKREERQKTDPKKRKVIIESEDEEQEISADDFFACLDTKAAEDKKKAPAESPAKKLKPSPKVKQEERKVKKESPKKESPKKKRIRDDFDSDSSTEDEKFHPIEKSALDDDNDDEEEEEFLPSPVKSKKSPIKPPKTPPKAKSPAKKTRKSPSSSSKKTKETIEVLEPTLERDSFEVDSIQVSEFMAGLTFVFTGVMEGLSRDDASDLIKMLGGRVTGQVSGKTTYLVVGELLEDGRPYSEGSKYRKATTELQDKIKLVMGKEKFYGLCHLYHEKAMKEKGVDPTRVIVKQEATVSTVISSDAPPAAAAAASDAAATNPNNKAFVNPYAKKKLDNPYTKGAATNPYAKTSNPYVKSDNPYGKTSKPSPTNDSASMPARSNTNNDLWVDRYKPTSTREILGNKTQLTKLQNWLKTWERTFLNGKASKKTFSNPKGPWKAALLSGPPGIGSEFYKCCGLFLLLFMVLLTHFFRRNNDSHFGFEGRWPRSDGVQRVGRSIEKDPAERTW